jgi:hypothetical protein
MKANLIGASISLLLLSAVPANAAKWVDRHVRRGPLEYRQLPGSDTCVPVTLMNAAGVHGIRFRYPNRVLQALDRVGPTTSQGTGRLGLAREAARLGMRAVPLGRNFAAAHGLSRRGIPLAASINPGRLPRGLQLALGGPFQSVPAGHEVLLRRVGPLGGALVEDPEGGVYALGPRQLRRAVGLAGDLTGLPLRRGF